MKRSIRNHWIGVFGNIAMLRKIMCSDIFNSMTIRQLYEHDSILGRAASQYFLLCMFSHLI